MSRTVVHVITGLGRGGAEQMLTQLVLVAARDPDGLRQVVVSLRDAGVHGTALEAAGIELHCLGMRSPLSLPVAVLRLAAILRRARPVLVMTWLYHADLVGILAAAIAGRPRMIWNLRCSNMDFSRYAATTRWTVRALAALSRRPWAVAANSAAGRRAHEALGYRPRQWLHLSNGFDLDVWHPDAVDRDAVRAEWGVGPEDVVVGMVGRVDPQKDHDTFLAAAAAVARNNPRARFVLAGQGTETLALPDSLAGRAHALGDRGDVPRLIRGFDIAVLASAYGEGFPNVVAEAMASGLPCAVTDVGDAAAIVGDCGTVVPPRDPTRMAEAIATLISAGPDERTRMGIRACQRVRDSWSLDTALATYQRLWHEDRCASIS